MSQEIKYTTDGKKVIVVGNLNSQEKIVQEIFIVNGNEIPSGENFVVKSLHDAPAVSWKETQLKNLELTYEKDKKEWDNRIETLNKEKKVAYDSLSARVKWLRSVAKEPRDAEFKTVINQIADFLSDSEKWVFTKGYSDWSLEKFNEEGCNNLIDRYESSYHYNNKRFDSMRLLSLYGRSDGSLTFRINEYSDGSGSDKDVVFFKSKEEALMFIQSEFGQIEKYCESDFKTAENFGLKIDSKKVAIYKAGKKANIEEQIKKYEKQIESLNASLIQLD